MLRTIRPMILAVSIVLPSLFLYFSAQAEGQSPYAYLVVGTNDTTGGVIYGVTLHDDTATPTMLASVYGGGVRDIAYDPHKEGIYIATTDTSDGLYRSSDDGQSWGTKKGVFFGPTAVAYGDDTFVAVGEQIEVSSDGGQTWSIPTKADGYYCTGELYSVAYGHGMFVAVGEGHIWMCSKQKKWGGWGKWHWQELANPNNDIPLYVVRYVTNADGTGQFLVGGGTSSEGKAPLVSILPSAPPSVQSQDIGNKSAILGIAADDQGNVVIVGDNGSYTACPANNDKINIGTNNTCTHYTIAEANGEPLTSVGYYALYQQFVITTEALAKGASIIAVTANFSPDNTPPTPSVKYCIQTLGNVALYASSL